jgi:ActR/RegA family two-component response regulator
MGTIAQQRPSAAARTAILTSTDASFRQRVRDALTGLRWQVREAAGGAETLARLDEQPPETVVLDSWLCKRSKSPLSFFSARRPSFCSNSGQRNSRCIRVQPCRWRNRR